MSASGPSGDAVFYMQTAIKLALKAQKKSTNFCVGALLVDEVNSLVLSTGYTGELEGNTHAEQCCLQKWAKAQQTSEEQAGSVLPHATALYTTMEPCVHRLSGNMSCTQRILRTIQAAQQLGDVRRRGICKVYVGIPEPSTFVQSNTAKAQLQAAGIEYHLVPGFEAEILKIAKAGHVQADDGIGGGIASSNGAGGSGAT